MAEKVEFYGEWFLPDNIDVRIKGILTYNSVEGFSTLNLLGSFENYKKHYQPPIILGVTDDDEDVTLYDCFLSNHTGVISNQTNQKSSNQSRTVFQITYILHGFHFHSIEQLKFNKIKSEILHLDDWLRITGFIPTRGERNESLIAYSIPESINFEAGNYSGKISFSVKESGLSHIQKSGELVQNVYYALESDEPQSFEQLYSEILKFQNFLVLSLYTHTNPLSIELFTDEYVYEHTVYTGEIPNLKSEIRKHRRTIKLYFPVRKEVKNFKAKSDWHMLFTYDDIRFVFPEMIKKWYDRYAELQPALHLVFEQFYSVEKVLETSFLNLAQAAETLHARLNPNKKQLPQETFDGLKQIVVDALPEEHKKLADALSNNYYLSLRLTELLENYSTPFLLEVIKDTDQFLKDVKNSRNYYTHYPDSRKPKHLEGSELINLKDKLLLLLISAFLIEIGFDRTKLQNLLKEKSRSMLSHLYKN